MGIRMEDWPEVEQSALQRWLDTASPDYTLQHQWGDDYMVCVDRCTNRAFAYERQRDKRCFVHPDHFHHFKRE